MTTTLVALTPKPAKEMEQYERICAEVARAERAEKANAALRAAAKWALTHIEVVARTGRVATGGEQNGNRQCFEWARDKISAALADTNLGADWVRRGHPCTVADCESPVAYCSEHVQEHLDLVTRRELETTAATARSHHQAELRRVAEAVREAAVTAACEHISNGFVADRANESIRAIDLDAIIRGTR